MCSPQVIHEAIDGEVVVINLENGKYYSLRGSGARVWAGVADRAGVDEIAAHLARSYHGADEAGASVAAFLAELESEELIVPSSEDPGPWAPSEPHNGARSPFEPPVLERFTDMQDLLLLDPVHEVDEAQGWPRAKPAP